MVKSILKSIFSSAILLFFLIAIFYVGFYAGAYTEWKETQDTLGPEYTEVNESRSRNKIYGCRSCKNKRVVKPLSGLRY